VMEDLSDTRAVTRSSNRREPQASLIIRLEAQPQLYPNLRSSYTAREQMTHLLPAH